MAHWQDRSALVTGGGSGIGKALGGALARRGARVWLSDVDGASAARAAKEIGHGAEGIALDVVDADAVRRHVEDVARIHGRVDAIFNNAGIGVGGDLRELNLEHFDRTIDVNVRGVVHGVLAVLPIMREQGGGTIVNTASAAGLLAVPLMAPYCLSKHAVVGLGASLRIEAEPLGIQVNTLCPAAIETPLLDSDVSRELGASWRPDIRAYLTQLGGAPYPVDRFAEHALDRIEKNEGVIVAPLGARVRLALGRLVPGLVEALTRRAYREALSTRPPDETTRAS